MGSWWVGKDRDGFYAALKDPKERVVRREQLLPPAQEPAVPTQSAPVVAVQEPQEPPPDPPPPAPDQASPRIRKKPREPVHTTWKPGGPGRVPKRVRPLLAIADDLKAHVEASEEAEADPALGRAAVVMFVGFVFRQRLDWIVGYTGYSTAECRRVIARLRRYGIWHKDGLIACRWMEAAFKKRPTQHDLRLSDIAFWLDACVGDGSLTREPTGDGDFRYGLASWETHAP